MSVLNQSGEEQVECPLCLESLEVDDLHFYPCTCGYQICRFCWNRIRETENGLCPACRKAYPENPADFTPLSQEEVAAIKTEKRAREQKRRNKTLESRRQLANVRVVQNNLVFVVGLPARLADPEILKKQEYFGKYGKIHKVVINQSTAYAGSQGPCASAYVTYTTSADALRAIQAVNNVTIDARQLKGSLGTTKYCANFMKNQPCPKADCMYLHDLGDSKASFTKEEMHQGLHQIYERKLHNALLAQDQANKIAQANGTATNGTDKNSNTKDGNPSFIPTTIVTSSSLSNSNHSSSSSSSQSTSSSSNSSQPPLSCSKEAWPSLSQSPPVPDILPATATTTISTTATTTNNKSKGKTNNKEQITSQNSDTNGTSKSTNSESNHKNPGKTKESKNKNKGDKQRTKQNNKTVSICSENEDLPIFTDIPMSATNKTNMSVLTSDMGQTDGPTVINNSEEEENFVNSADIQDSFVTADLQESFLNNDSFVNSAGGSLDSDERHSLLENHDLILDNEDNHSLLEDDSHNLLNDHPGLDNSNLLLMRHRNMLGTTLSDRNLLSSGQNDAETFGLIDSSNRDYLVRERYQNELLMRQNELLARQNQQRNLLGDSTKNYLGTNYHNTNVLPPFGMRMDGSLPTAPTSSTPAMAQNFSPHNNLSNGFSQSQGQGQAESEGTRYIGESGMDKFITDFHKNQQMKMYMQQTQDPPTQQNSHNMPGQNIQNHQNMLAQNIQQNAQNMLGQSPHNMQNSQHMIGQNVQPNAQNMISQNAQNMLSQNAQNMLGQNAQHMLGQNAQNMLGQNAQNMLGQNAQNMLGQNAQSMLGQNSQNVGYGHYQPSEMQSHTFLESRLRKYGENQNEPQSQIQVHEDTSDISLQKLSENMTSTSIVDDDLDFDPFKETQKALAEMMESEQMGHQNGKIGADLVDRLGSRRSTRMPPPGFSHMNAFGLGVPRPQQTSAPGFSTPASIISDWTQIDPAIVSTSVGGFPHKSQMMPQPNFQNPQQNQELYNRFNQTMNVGNQPGNQSGHNGINQSISKILQNAQHNPAMALAQIQQQLTMQQQNGMVLQPQLQNGQNGQYLQHNIMQQQKLQSLMLQQAQNTNGWNMNVLPPNYNMGMNGSNNLYGAQMLMSNGSLENKQYSMPIPPGFSNLPLQNASKNGNLPTECIESK